MCIVSDGFYTKADKIVVVLDNPNIHVPAAFYSAFEPQEDSRLVERFEFRHTPKHGSRLNIVEIKSAFTRYCLDRRIPDKEAWIRDGVTVWKKQRNSVVVKVHWQVITNDYRYELKSLSPKFRA